jgi:SAM-dependent methyltransferase
MNKGPTPMLDIFGGVSFYIVSTALKLNIFEMIRTKPLTATELSDKINASERGITLLLDGLESLGYVKRKSNIYYNTKMTEKWMTDESAINFKVGFEYYYPIMHELWPYLHESVLKGEPYIEFYQWLSKHSETSHLYQQFMMNLARFFIPEMIRKLKIDKTCRRVIDIGGGHALYSIALCEKYSDLRVTIFDSPYVRPLSLENIDNAQVNDRIQFISGDYMSDDIGNGFDAAMLFNVIHEHTAEENEQLINKISKSLSDGGCIIIMDNMHEKKISKAIDFFMRMYSLLYYHSLGGQNFSFVEISRWLKAAGCTKLERINLRESGLSLILGYF